MARRRAANDPSVRVELSPRQREVLGLIAKGATNGEIANRLGLSLEGAKWHVREIFARLGVDSREEAAAWWRDNGASESWGWSSLALIGGGTIAVGALAAIAVVTMLVLRDHRSDVSAEPRLPATTTATTAPPRHFQIAPTPVKPQPPLREVASGRGWRLLLADDGLGLPPVVERVLAVAYDGPRSKVDVLDANGRIAARVETGYAPMARIDPINGDLLISDWVEAVGEGPRSARLLVFDLTPPTLRAEIPFAEQRVNLTVPSTAVWVSEDSRWFYWIEHGTVCPSGGDEEVCDQHIVHAVDLSTLQASHYRAPLPVGCGFPRVDTVGGPALVAVCAPRTGSTAWRIDAAAGPQDRPEPAATPGRVPTWVGSRSADVLLEVESTNDGSLTRLTLSSVQGSTVAEYPVADTWGAYLLDERTALLLRSDGRLERVDLLTGIGAQLPYAIDPGLQGLDIRFYR